MTATVRPGIPFLARWVEAHLVFAVHPGGRLMLVKNAYDDLDGAVLSRAEADALVAGYRARGSRVRVYEFASGVN